MSIKINDKFGQLTVVEIKNSRKKGFKRYVCKCACGELAEFQPNQLLRGRKSCGCLGSKHNMYGTRIYNIWAKIKYRCDNEQDQAYKWYGARGVSYDPEWSEFSNFYKDMKEGYSDDLTIDRIDVNGDYTKENCRWADSITQMNNMTTNKFVTYDGETMSLADMARKYNLDYVLFKSRIEKGVPVKDAMKPAKKKEELTYQGETKTVAEWAVQYGLTYHQLKKRLMYGWSVERAITQPLRKSPKKN